MKTQANKKLIFKKNEIIELNDMQQLHVYGGTTTSIDIQSNTGGGTDGPDGPDVPVDRPPTKPFCSPIVIGTSG